MAHGLISMVKAELRAIGRRRNDRRQVHTDATIVEVYFWAVHNDRPVSWACIATNWAGVTRRVALPSQSAMSRRLRTRSVKRLISRIESRVRPRVQPQCVVYIIDGKALQISAHSRDPDATWGRISGGKGKGYKLHLLMAVGGTVVAWEVAPLNVDEHVVARKLLKKARCAGYILADANYDTSRLHDVALEYGGQLVAPRNASRRGKGLGNHYQSKGRLRSIEMLEESESMFGRELYKMRGAIERKFGHLASTPGLLTHLPAWVRTLPRVRMWVQAKLVLADLRAVQRRQMAQSVA